MKIVPHLVLAVASVLLMSANASAINTVLADMGTQVGAGNVLKGTTDNIIFKFTLSPTGGSPNLNSVQCLFGGNYASADITNLKVRYSTDATLDVGDATKSTYTSIPTAGLLTFPAFVSTALTSGTTCYFFITADIAAGATVGKTIYVSSFGTGNMTLSSGTSSGSTTAGGTQTIVYPSIALANNGTQVAPANIAIGASDQVLHKISMAVTSADATLTGLQCATTAGTYASADVTNLKLRYSTDATLDAGDATLSTLTTPGTAGTKIFPAFSQVITSGTTGYFFITADIAVGATAGNTIRVAAMATTDITFAAGTKSGNTTLNGTGYQTIATPAITLADNGTQVTAAGVAQGTSTHVLDKISLAVATAGATLTGLQCATAGTYISSDITNLKVRYSTDNVLDAGDATLSTYTTPGVAGTKVFPSFTSQVIASGTTGYIFITADIFAGASAGRTISVSAIGTGSVTFTSGTKAGSSTGGGTQTFSGVSYSNIYEVTTTADAGAGSLRAAIASANGSAGRDYIYFNLGAGGPYTITLTTTTLYGINSYDIGLTTTDNSGVTIDGWTNLGNNGTPGSVAVTSASTATPMDPNYKVILTTNNTFNTILHLNSNNNIIKGLVFTNWGDNPTDLRDIGILVSGSSNQILGCRIGTNSAGTALGGSYEATGIYIWSSSNIIGDGTAAGANLIAGSTWNATAGGIRMEYDGPEGFVVGTGTTGNTIKGNMIGLQVDGVNQIAGIGSVAGISIANAGSVISGNTIGGTGAGDGNVISGFTTGIDFGSTANSNNVYGNIIGPCADGVSYVSGNRQTIGIYLTGSSNTIGGNTSGHRNIISGNETYGIWINNSFATSNVIKGNYIGPSSSLANFRTASGTPSSPSDHKGGLQVLGNSHQIYGIAISNSAANNTIGGTAAGEANVIAYNTSDGIYITGAGSSGNKITRNPIYSNSASGKEINLDYLATPGNNGKAIPVITTSTIASVAGTSAVGDVIEVFKNTGGGLYDAMTYVGTAVTNGAGNWSLGVALAAGDRVMANATNGSNNTSEFTVGSSPLPVELLSFSAKCTQEGKVLCNWTTASEINNDYFTVERGSDPLGSWSVLGIVKGAGNSSMVNSYVFTDPDPLKGNVYYRLKQTDFNGQFEYFKTVSLRCDEKQSDLNIFPNPVLGSSFNMTLGENANEVLVVLYDVTGKESFSKLIIKANEDSTVYMVDMSGKLAPGIYMVRATSDDKVLSKKIIVK